MSLSALDVGGALLLGGASSLHCIAMCGPLGCAASGSEPAGRMSRIVAYQLGRIGAYALLGAALGGVGRAVAQTVRVDLRAAVPWLLVGALLLAVVPSGVRLLPASSRFAQLLRRLRSPLQRLPAGWRALALGLLTPLLPCGVLYSIFPAVIATQRAATGALLMAAFAAASAPSLLLAQVPLTMLSSRRPAAFESWRVVVPLVAAAILVFRTIATTRGGSCH